MSRAWVWVQRLPDLYRRQAVCRLRRVSDLYRRQAVRIFSCIHVIIPGRFDCIHKTQFPWLWKIGSHEQSLGMRLMSASSGFDHQWVGSLLLSTGGAFLKCSVGVCPTVLALLPGKRTHTHTHTYISSRFRSSYIYFVNIFLSTLNKYMEWNSWWDFPSTCPKFYLTSSQLEDSITL